MKYSLKAKIVSNKLISEDWIKLELEAPEIAAAAEPGQFIQARSWDGSSPLLRRPFSIAGAKDGNIELIIKIVGDGTRYMASGKVGEIVEILGPLGNSFSKVADNENFFAVAGGVGIAPFRFMISRIPPEKIQLFFGSRDGSELPVLDDSVFNEQRIIITTESDPPVNNRHATQKGFVTQALEKKLKSALPSSVPQKILACGPLGMMAAAAKLAADNSIPCEVSMETYMGCGFGACMGCAVPVNKNESGKTFLHACTDGPVFDSKMIDWEALCRLNTK